MLQRIRLPLAVVGGVISATNYNYSSCSDGKSNLKGLYPPLKPYQEGFLKVSSEHTVYYSVFGNPNGKPVVYLHGGPGGSSKPGMGSSV
jgi:hypothetical protein